MCQVRVSKICVKHIRTIEDDVVYRIAVRVAHSFVITISYQVRVSSSCVKSVCHTYTYYQG